MIILLGGSGYVGTAFCKLFEERGLPYRSVSRQEVDYTQVSTLVSLLQETRPAFLILAAGYTGRPNVDSCELYKVECLDGNAVLPGVVKAACELTETSWGHVSSGCIFTGDKGAGIDGKRIGFSEKDPANFSFRQNNCSFYSGTKALGEEILGFDPRYFSRPSATPQPATPSCYVWRLRIPFNHEDSPRNYLTKVMRYERLLQATNSLSHLQEFVRACWECFEGKLPFGIYNVTNPGYVSTSEVVEMIKKSGVINKEFRFFKDETDFMHTAAVAPRSNCVLDSSKILRAGIHLTEVHEAIEASLRSWKTAR